MRASNVLPDPVGPIEQDVGFFNLHIRAFPAQRQALVVIVNRDRQDAFCWSLANDVLIKIGHDVAWRGNLAEQLLGVAATPLFLIKNVVA